LRDHVFGALALSGPMGSGANTYMADSKLKYYQKEIVGRRKVILCFK